jgi:D-amino-acid dehydrogenase
MTNSSTRHVIVIGGGIIGAASAHFLDQAGWRVTILERGAFGMGCSHANCGFVCPSHVLPLAMPGAFQQAFKAMIAKDSPFYIKPRFDWALWSWLTGFVRRCNERDMLAAGRAIQPLLDSSRRLYDQLMQTPGLACEWETRGLLFVFQTPSAMNHHAATVKLQREQFGFEARRFDGEAVSELEPALKPGSAGGWLYEGDAHLRPDKLLESWRAHLQSRGVTIREQCAVEGIAGQHGEARALTTSQGRLEADAFVVATGAWTPLLATHLGCKIPIQPGKGYSITMRRPAICPRYPLMFEEHRVAVTPMQSGYRLGSTMEFAGYDTTLNRGRLELLKRGAEHYLREPYTQPVEEEWYGWRPMTYDSLPIIGKSPAYANVWIAAGHNMLGLSMAPATGRLVTELITGTTPHLDPTPYAVTRF